MDSRTLINTFYTLQTILKGVFLIMSLINMNYTLLIAFFASLIGMLRVCKTPQFNKQYLAKIMLNNHGQNILYITFGSMGFVNYLYYAPIALFFFYGIAQYINMKYPNINLSTYINILRNNRFYVMQGRCRLQIVFFLYLMFSLPLDFIGRGLKLFMIGQFLLIKYRINNQFRFASGSVNAWIEKITSPIGFVNAGYKKLAGWIYEYANKRPEQQQASSNNANVNASADANANPQQSA